MAYGRVEIDQERCKGCRLCTTVCPQQVLAMDDHQLNSRGYHPAQFADPQNECTGCGVCAVICPDVCIRVFREAPVKRRALAAVP